MATPETGAHLTIRNARSEDAPAIREILNDAVEDGLATFETELRSLEDQRQRILAAEKDPRHPILVAELRNWICGLIAIEPHDERNALEDIGEVVVFVRRSFRSYGIGRQLMRVAMTEAARLGYRKLLGRVLADNRESLHLCQAVGWRVVGCHQQHARHKNRLRDVVVVECLLEPGRENA